MDRRFKDGGLRRSLPLGRNSDKLNPPYDIHEHDRLDEVRLADWVKQASRLPGERM